MNIEELDTADRGSLLTQWNEVFNRPPPKGMSSPFLRRFIAYETQAKRHGGLPKGFRRALASAARGERTTKSPDLKPGGRLLREWNGSTHVVDVLDKGFLWNGTRYRSLSVIAREITGAHWSGPRFFGLRAKPGP